MKGPFSWVVFILHPLLLAFSIQNMFEGKNIIKHTKYSLMVSTLSYHKYTFLFYPYASSIPERPPTVE